MPDEQKTRCEPAIPAREHLSKQSASFAEARPARRAPEGLARRLPIGSEPQPDGGVTFRVWAPRCGEVHLEFEAASENSVALQPEPGGYFSLTAPTAKAGMRYRFRLDRGETSLPDPASRYQPEGPQGPSEIVDPGAFAWTDCEWRGLPREQLVIYELHVGVAASRARKSP